MRWDVSQPIESFLPLLDGHELSDMVFTEDEAVEDVVRRMCRKHFRWAAWALRGRWKRWTWDGFSNPFSSVLPWFSMVFIKKFIEDLSLRGALSPFLYVISSLELPRGLSGGGALPQRPPRVLRLHGPLPRDRAGHGPWLHRGAGDQHLSHVRGAAQRSRNAGVFSDFRCIAWRSAFKIVENLF